MNTEGNIRYLGQHEVLNANEVLINRKPKKNCKKCWGKGFELRILEHIKERIVCYCVRKVK